MSFLISRLVSWRVRTAQGFIPPQPFKKWPRCMFARAPAHSEGAAATASAARGVECGAQALVLSGQLASNVSAAHIGKE
jgi:hypothetical protein